MKVVCVLPRLRRTGGAERSLVEILPLLVARGIEPVVVALAEARPTGFEDDVRAAGIDVRILGVKRMRTAARAIAELVELERPALVHSALYTANVSARLGARRARVPVLTTLTNMCRLPAQLDNEGFGRWRLRGTWALDAWTARHLTAHFHAISHGVADWAHTTWRIPRDRFSVVYRSRDPARLGTASATRRRATRAALGIDNDAPVVLNVGRQHVQKGQVDLVEAIGRLAVTHPNAVLIQAGLRQPGVSAAMEKAAATAGIADRVLILGHRDDVPDLLAAADVFAFPSRWEGLGGALIEALALGVPVVASDLPPLREAAGDAAILVPPGMPRSLATAIAQVLDDATLGSGLATRGVARYHAMFSPDTIADQMAALYHRVAGT